MLLSNTIVFIPRNPKFVTWLMEDKLEPFVHYVPIAHDLSNIDDMILWCERNLDKTKSIIRQSTLYMYDMFFHASADNDNMKICFEMMQLYNNQFSSMPKFEAYPTMYSHILLYFGHLNKLII